MKLISKYRNLILLTLLLSWGISPVNAAKGLVVSEHKLASKVGADILRAGGNAVDAAVAVGYALAVVNPCCGNIGGGGFMLIHQSSGKNIFLNFREKAPLRATRDMYLDARGRIPPNATSKGWLAVAVPGTVLGLDTALQKYGTMKREQVMQPAIDLAKNGFVLTPFLVNQMAAFQDDFRKNPVIAAIFLKNGQPYQAGQLFVQTDLANTLTNIALHGPDYFYRGPIAEVIVKASDAHGGILSLQDFASYHVEELTPLHCNYHDYLIVSAPPPSSGGVTLCEMLNILENFPLSLWGRGSVNSTRTIIEAMRYGFTDRNNKLGDPNFVKNPVDQLLSKEYAKNISDQIKSSDHAQPSKVSLYPELTDTTHASVVDSKGNAVALTYTLNGFFGAKVMAENTGFLLNNEMDDFAARPGVPNQFGLVESEVNAIAPGKRPLSSMTPTMIFKNGRLFMVVGSPGGPRIITSVLHTILNVIDFNFPIQDAVGAPRFHFQATPDMIGLEPLSIPAWTLLRLELLGYHFEMQGIWSAVEAILRDENGNAIGGNDPRRPDGAAISDS